MGDSYGLQSTNDSGHTWTPVNNSIGDFDRDIVSIKFYNSMAGYFTSGSGAVYQTNDGGISWIPYGKSAINNCPSIEFSGDSLVYFGGIYGTIVKSPLGSNFGTVSGCPGSNFTIISDVANSYYQWQVNRDSVFVNITDDSVYSGANTNILIINNLPESWGGYTYRCAAGNNNISYSKIHSFKFQTQWSGAIDNAWENAGNWSCGVTPGINTDVIITGGTVILNSNAAIRSLTLSPGAVFKVNSGYTLTVTH